MEGQEGNRSTGNGRKAEQQEENILQFLDSVDSYLTLFDSLSSTLRQGWLELASARHSMGASRVNSALFDLKLHSAATTLQVAQQDGESPPVELQEKLVASNGAPIIVDDKVQKERSKSLSVFGTLVSPKLRGAQLSFETALETLIEIANTRSLMLLAFAQVRQEMESTNE